MQLIDGTSCDECQAYGISCIVFPQHGEFGESDTSIALCFACLKKAVMICVEHDAEWMEAQDKNT